MVQTPYVIGVGGPSGSGKTVLSSALGRTLAARIVCLDAYYRDLEHLPFLERQCINFDTPEALDRDLLRTQIAALAQGRTIERPAYDFATHTRTATGELVQPGRFLIVEGLFALYWEDIRMFFGTKVFVAAADAVCFGRRLERDVRERGRTPESVLRQYEQTVRPMSERYVLPSRRFADVVVSGTDPIEASVAAVLSHIEDKQIAARQT